MMKNGSGSHSEGGWVMEFEFDGLIFSNECIPPAVKPFPKISNPTQFLHEFNRQKSRVSWVLIEKKYDGTNLRLVKYQGKIYLLTRNKNAENRFAELFKKALNNNPALINFIKFFYDNWDEKDYIAGELIAKELKAPYTSQFQPANFVIFEFWEDKIGKFYPVHVLETNSFITGEIQEYLYIDEVNQELLKNLANLAWLRDYEGFVIKALAEDNSILFRGKIKPIHYGFPTHESQIYKNKLKKEKTDKKTYATEEEILQAIEKVRLRLSYEEFIDPKIVMPLIAKEVAEEFGKRLPASAYGLYMQVIAAKRES